MNVRDPVFIMPRAISYRLSKIVHKVVFAGSLGHLDSPKNKKMGKNTTVSKFKQSVKDFTFSLGGYTLKGGSQLNVRNNFNRLEVKALGTDRLFSIAIECSTQTRCNMNKAFDSPNNLPFYIQNHIPKRLAPF